MRRVLAATALCVLVASAHARDSAAQTKPEGEMRTRGRRLWKRSG